MTTPTRTSSRVKILLLAAVILIGVPALYAHMDSHYREQERWLHQFEMNVRGSMAYQAAPKCAQSQEGQHDDVNLDHQQRANIDQPQDDR